MIINPNRECRLAAEKALMQLGFIDSAYNLGIWNSPDSKGKWKHDLALMIAHNDLSHIRLELLGRDHSVIFEYRIDFIGQRISSPMTDHTGGLELALIDIGDVVDKRIIVQRNGRDAMYRDLLQINWTNAEVLPKRTGTTFQSEHTRKITGGRQNSECFVSNEAMREFRVVRTGAKGFGFAVPMRERNKTQYFFSLNSAPQVWRPAIGDIIEAIPVQTPKGLQLRNIRVLVASGLGRS
jgi:hypothetical protein